MLEVLQKSFHIQTITPFYKNHKKEIIKMPKLYFNDNGLRNSFLNNYNTIENRTDKGQLLENYVYIRLSELYSDSNIHFWRTSTGNEIDFIINESNISRKAYEVKFSSKNINKNKYKKFRILYPDFDFQFISYNFDETGVSVPILKL